MLRPQRTARVDVFRSLQPSLQVVATVVVALRAGVAVTAVVAHGALRAAAELAASDALPLAGDTGVRTARMSRRPSRGRGGRTRNGAGSDEGKRRCDDAEVLLH